MVQCCQARFRRQRFVGHQPSAAFGKQSAFVPQLKRKVERSRCFSHSNLGQSIVVRSFALDQRQQSLDVRLATRGTGVRIEPTAQLLSQTSRQSRLQRDQQKAANGRRFLTFPVNARANSSLTRATSLRRRVCSANSRPRPNSVEAPRCVTGVCSSCSWRCVSRRR